jgi:hypothetical protein
MDPNNVLCLRPYWLENVSNTASHCCQIVSIWIWLFEKPLLSNGCCTFAYLVVITQQQVNMLHYKSLV